jgi:hypothetical protein
MKKLTKIPRVANVEVRPPNGLNLTFDDGALRDVDLADDLSGAMFEPSGIPNSSLRCRPITARWCDRAV